MTTEGQPYVSGNWVVREGHEDEFVARWSEFTGWSLANMLGAERFVLIREREDPRHFVSYGSWRDHDAVTAWRATPEFQERLAACRALCEDFRGTDFTVSAAVE
jgi:heme-degrading monooxygenase HmoA